jgi:hypothetical protein
MVEFGRFRILSLAALTAAGMAAPIVIGETPVEAQQADPSAVHHAVDPGVRGGPAGAGGPLHGLDTNEADFFDAARPAFRRRTR